MHPIILPAKHRLTDLIVRREHLKLLHAAPLLLLTSLRERYWPSNGRNICKRIYHECTTCFRFNAKSIQYLMGSLPKDRITPSRPFTVSGVLF